MTRYQRARAAQSVAKLITGLAAAGTVAVALALLGFLVYKGLPTLSWALLTTPPNPLKPGGGGFGPAIVGTMYLVALTAAIVLPIGIAAGIYLAEYAPRNPATRSIRLAIANMAGVPSIVYGLFGLAAFSILLHLRTSLLAGSLTLACMTLPVVITATEEALRQIPRDLREASLALGASRLRTTTKVVLPAAAPGIVTGSILGLSRAAGETAPLLFTAVVPFMVRAPRSVLQPVMALPYHVFNTIISVPNPPAAQVWGAALVLVAGVSLINVLAAAWRSAARRRIRW